MTRKIYALLVGIDEYPSPIPRLRGCVNDVVSFETYLSKRTGEDTGVGLEVLSLTNERATRQAVIDGFRALFAKAGKEDVALFYYSGHGSQEQAPEEFWAIEPDHLDETLVLFDSREAGKWDLADKELAKLIGEVGASGAHVVVILDCCHSGSGTREIGTVVRRAPTDLRRRPIESFLDGAVEASSGARSSSRDAGGWAVPDARHVLFAACRADEEAKETTGGGEHRGAFSYSLGEALKSAAGIATYRDLFARTSSLVSGQVKNQTPQLESTRSDDLDALFLDGTIRPSPATYKADFVQGRWQINGGAAHGIPRVDGSETTRLALFRFDAPASDLDALDKALGIARVEAVQAATSQLVIEKGDTLDTSQTYKAVIISLPVPRTGVALVGDRKACDLVREALATAAVDNEPSPFVFEASTEPPEFRLIARDGRFVITRPEDERPLVAKIEGLDRAGARLAVKRLEHMARWSQALRLSNPASSIRPGDVKLAFLVDGEEVTGTDIRLEYRPDKHGESVAPTFKVSMTNTTGRDLYCGLLDLTQRYRISAELLNAGCEKLEAGQTVWANNGQEIYATVPDEVFNNGVVEYKDWLKLVVCTQPFDARLLELPTLDMDGPQGDRSRAIARNGSLNRLMERIVTRELGSGPAAKIDDWQATGVAFTTVRPQATTPVPVPGATAALAGGVTLDGHPSFRAGARLTTATLSTRDLNDITLPRMLYDDPRVSSPWNFTPSRGTDAGLSVLELTGVNDPAAVTPENPLRVRVPLALAPEDHVLPVAFDGEFFLPLGGVESRQPGSTVVVINRLPPPQSDERSLTGAIKIFFQKIVGTAIGVGTPYPILGIAQVGADGSVVPVRDPEEVRARVQRASRVVLFVHGIIGETSTMVPSLQLARLANQAPLASLYDLALTFDYENLNTTIEDNGRLLEKLLRACGLVPGNGRVLDVVAHSMGGLVARWFIEKEGGNKVVRRLVMLGTPNGGSPWPKVVDWATMAIALGLNQLTAIPWPSAVLGLLQKSAESPTVALYQMTAGSDVLKALAATDDPGIPYVMLAGNTSIIPAATQVTDPRKGSRLSRLFARLTSPEFLHEVANPFFLNQENDIAVSVTSMRDIAEGRKPPYDVRPVGCDHLSYFRDPAGLKALSTVLAEGFGPST